MSFGCRRNDVCIREGENGDRCKFLLHAPIGMFSCEKEFSSALKKAIDKRLRCNWKFEAYKARHDGFLQQGEYVQQSNTVILYINAIIDSMAGIKASEVSPNSFIELIAEIVGHEVLHAVIERISPGASNTYLD